MRSTWKPTVLTVIATVAMLTLAGCDAAGYDIAEADMAAAALAGKADRVADHGHVIVAGAGIEGLVELDETYATLAARFGEDGEEIGMTGMTRAFANGALEVTFADTEFNGRVDADERAIAITCYDTLGARLDGVPFGAAQRDIAEALRPELYANPPVIDGFPSGDLSLYPTQGLILGFDEGRLIAITVHSAYPLAPETSFDPDNAILTIDGADLLLGDGREGGDAGASPNDYLDILGPPDFRTARTQSVTVVDVTIELDFYAGLGLQLTWVSEIDIPFLSDEEPNELVAAVLLPPFAGRTANGIGLGSPRDQVESALELELDEVRELLGLQIEIYNTPSGARFGVVYADGRAAAFILNVPSL